MNKEKLISLKVAKLAKEKGFDWEVHYLFSSNGFHETYNMSIPENMNSKSITKQSVYNADWYLSRPTQSLLQKWLRDEYDIHIHTARENYFQISEYKYYYNVICRGKKSDILGSVDTFSNLMAECSQNVEGNYLNDEKFFKLIFERGYAFDSYEEALEDGLFEALKLIE